MQKNETRVNPGLDEWQLRVVPRTPKQSEQRLTNHCSPGARMIG